MSKSKVFFACRLLPVTVLLLQACGGDGGGGGGGGTGGEATDASPSGGAGGEVVGGSDAAVNGGSGGDPVGEPDAAVGVEPDAAVGVEPDAAVAPPVPNESCDDAAANAVTLALDAADATQGTLSPVATAQRYFILTQGGADPAPGTAVVLFTDAKPAEDEFLGRLPGPGRHALRPAGRAVDAGGAERQSRAPVLQRQRALLQPPGFGRRPVLRPRRRVHVRVRGRGLRAGRRHHPRWLRGVRGVALRPDLVESEPNDDAASASPVEYTPTGMGGYYSVVEMGASGSPTDVDVWSFSVPVDAFAGLDNGAGEVAGACGFSFFRAGVDGSGSSAAAGVIASVADSADPDGDRPHGRLRGSGRFLRRSASAAGRGAPTCSPSAGPRTRGRRRERLLLRAPHPVPDQPAGGRGRAGGGPQRPTTSARRPRRSSPIRTTMAP